MSRWTLLIFLSFFSLFPTALFGEDSEALQDLESRLERIELRALREEELLKEVRSSRASLRRELSALEQKAVELRQRKEDLEGEIESLSDQAGEIERVYAEVLEGLEELKALRRDRLRALYQHPRSERVVMLFQSGEKVSFGALSYYLARLQQADNEIAMEWQQRQQELEALLEEQQIVKTEQSQAAEDLDKQLEEQRTLIARQQELSRALAQREQEQQRALTALQSEAVRLEAVVKTIVQGQTASSRPEAFQARRRNDAGKGAPPLPLESGRLPSPVAGSLVRSHELNTFQREVFRKGSLLQASRSPEVRAVGDGGVVFRGEMPGFGKTVILRHGGEDFSVYALLSEIEVRTGQSVLKGEKLGMVGASEGSDVLYFEVRRSGKVLNPRKFLALRKG